jgi:hypothetical protein
MRQPGCSKHKGEKQRQGILKVSQPITWLYIFTANTYKDSPGNPVSGGVEKFVYDSNTISVAAGPEYFQREANDLVVRKYPDTNTLIVVGYGDNKWLIKKFYTSDLTEDTTPPYPIYMQVGDSGNASELFGVAEGLKPGQNYFVVGYADYTTVGSLEIKAALSQFVW